MDCTMPVSSAKTGPLKYSHARSAEIAAMTTNDKTTARFEICILLDADET